MWINDLVHM